VIAKSVETELMLNLLKDASLLYAGSLYA